MAGFRQKKLTESVPEFFMICTRSEKDRCIVSRAKMVGLLLQVALGIHGQHMLTWGRKQNRPRRSQVHTLTGESFLPMYTGGV